MSSPNKDEGSPDIRRILFRPPVLCSRSNPSSPANSRPSSPALASCSPSVSFVTDLNDPGSPQSTASSLPGTPDSSRPSTPIKFERVRSNGRRASAPIIGKTKLSYKMSKCTCKLIKSILETHGMIRCEKESTAWTIMWNSGHAKPQVLSSLEEHQRINHFPGSSEITRKDRLHSNMSEMMAKFGVDQFQFVPQTFVLPDQSEEFKKYCKEEGLARKNKKRNEWYENGETGPWIAKPIASSRGRGIFVFDSLKELQDKENSSVLVSKYIPNPYLIDGFKFDLRLYVLVTSYTPLRIYLYQEGLGRFATEKYANSSKSLGDKFMHLTNYSVNKSNANFVQNEDADVDNVGSKWSLSAIKDHLQSAGADVIKLTDNIKSLVVKTILSVQPFISARFAEQVPFRHNCFELYGFDVLIDDLLNPWLLEVNLSPSLSTDSPLDLRIKSGVICDLLNMVGVFNAKQSTSFPTKEPIPPQSAPFLDFVAEEFSYRGGFDLVFPTRDWEAYLPFLEKNDDILLYQAMVDKLFTQTRGNKKGRGILRNCSPSPSSISLSPASSSSSLKSSIKGSSSSSSSSLKSISRSASKSSSNLLKSTPITKTPSSTNLKNTINKTPSFTNLKNTMSKTPSSTNLLQDCITISSSSSSTNLKASITKSPSISSSNLKATPISKTPSSTNLKGTLARTSSSNLKGMPITKTASSTSLKSSQSRRAKKESSSSLLRSAPSTFFTQESPTLKHAVSRLTVSTDFTPQPIDPNIPFYTAPRDLFGNIIGPRLVTTPPAEPPKSPTPLSSSRGRTPPPRSHPYNEGLLKLLESSIEVEEIIPTKSQFKEMELRPIHAREIFTAYLQRILTRLTALSQKTIYDQFYSASTHINFQKFNFSEVSDGIQLVNLVDKFLSGTSFSLPPSRASTPSLAISRATTPEPPKGRSLRTSIDFRPSTSCGVPAADSNVLLSVKAGQVLRSLETYLTNYKLKTTMLKKKHHFGSGDDKDAEWVDWEKFVSSLNSYSDSELEKLLERFGEGDYPIKLPT